MRAWREAMEKTGIGGGGIVAAGVLVAALAGPAAAQTSPDFPHLEVAATPYGWALGLDGTVGLLNRTASVDVSFRDLLKHLDGAAMLSLEARYARWGLGADLIYANVSGQHATPGPFFSSATLDARLTILDLGPRVRLIDTRRIAFDALVGARYWSLKNALTLDPGVLAGRKDNLDKRWTDPILGARTFLTLSRHWTLQARGDMGWIATSSQSTWQALGGLDYKLSSRWLLRGGYRHIDVNFRDNSDEFRYDVGMGGPILGGSYRF